MRKIEIGDRVILGRCPKFPEWELASGTVENDDTHGMLFLRLDKCEETGYKEIEVWAPRKDVLATPKKRPMTKKHALTDRIQINGRSLKVLGGTLDMIINTNVIDSKKRNFKGSSGFPYGHNDKTVWFKVTERYGRPVKIFLRFPKEHFHECVVPSNCDSKIYNIIMQSLR